MPPINTGFMAVQKAAEWLLNQHLTSLHIDDVKAMLRVHRETGSQWVLLAQSKITTLRNKAIHVAKEDGRVWLTYSIANPDEAREAVASKFHLAIDNLQYTKMSHANGWVKDSSTGNEYIVPPNGGDVVEVPKGGSP